MAVLPKANYRFNVIPIKLHMPFFTELEQIIQKFIWNHKRPRIEKAIRGWGVGRNRRHNSPRLQTILQSYSDQNNVVLVQKQIYGSMEEINPDTHSWLVFDKVCKNIKWGKDSLFSKWRWENWTAAYKSMKLEHTLTPCTEINSKWLKDLNIRATIKLLEENRGKTFSDINSTKVFLCQFPRQ